MTETVGLLIMEPQHCHSLLLRRPWAQALVLILFLEVGALMDAKRPGGASLHDSIVIVGHRTCDAQFCFCSKKIRSS